MACRLRQAIRPCRPATCGPSGPACPPQYHSFQNESPGRRLPKVPRKLKPIYLRYYLDLLRYWVLGMVLGEHAWEN